MATSQDTLPATRHPAHRVSREFRLPVRLRKFSNRRYLCWLALALSMIVGRIVILPLLPVPDPRIHDEYSYLLAADTFAHGRLANPAPVHPEFFESPHILVYPTYSSIYPPAQGAMLALGQKLGGHPYWGVVVAGALMVFLFCWATNAWLPPHWTLIAGFLSAILFFVRHYWFESYWGGSMAASGGALVLGGLGYVLRDQLRPARVTLGLGAVVLFFTRPYEGGVLALGVLTILAIHWARSSPDRRSAIWRAVALPNAAVLLAAVPVAALYNLRVTGRATDLPYLYYVRELDRSPKLFFLPPVPPREEYSNANLRKIHEWEVAPYENARRAPIRTLLLRPLPLLAAGLEEFAAAFLLLIGLPWVRMNGRKNLLIGLLLLGLIALLPETYLFSHYMAPFTPLVLILIVASARALWYRLATTRFAGPALCVGLILFFAPLVADYVGALQAAPTPRAQFIRRLQAMGGKHLVFVDYDDGWSAWEPNSEWVYNGADLEASQILFAHARSENENQQLLDENKTRRAWIVRLGPKPSDVRLQEYRAPSAGALKP